MSVLLLVLSLQVLDLQLMILPRVAVNRGLLVLLESGLVMMAWLLEVVLGPVHAVNCRDEHAVRQIVMLGVL